MKKFALSMLIFSSLIGNPLAWANESQQTQIVIDSPQSNANKLSDVIYGPVIQQDTLWRIARDYRNSSAFANGKPESLYPVMYGIYVLNPNAFKDDNVNQLLNNAMLKMPTASFVASIDLETARIKMEGDEKVNGLNSVAEASLYDLTLQYSESLESIQTLLTENALLASQLQTVSDQLTHLSQRVDGDVQEQLNAQAELQAQLYALLENSNQVSEKKVQLSSDNALKDLLQEPMIIISLLSGMLFCAFVILGLWLFSRRPKMTSNEHSSSKPVEKIVNVIDLSETDFSDSPFTPPEPKSQPKNAQQPDLNSESNTEFKLKSHSESDSDVVSSIIDDIPDIHAWEPVQKSSDESIINDLENTDFDELLHSLEPSNEEVSEFNTTPQSDDNSYDSKNTDEFIDVDTLLDDMSEMEEEPEIDLLKNIEGMPQPSKASDIIEDDVLSSDLDLARVYIEMDDILEAQQLLRKVILRGSADQKAEAQHILTQLENQ